MNEQFFISLDKTEFFYGEKISGSLQLAFFESIQAKEISIILEEFIPPRKRINPRWWARDEFIDASKYVLSRVTIPAWEYQVWKIPFELQIPKEDSLYFEFLFKGWFERMPQWIKDILWSFLGRVGDNNHIKTHKIIATIHTSFAFNKTTSRDVEISLPFNNV